MKSKVYIAGKMRGVPYFNFPAFDKARNRLLNLGLTPLSPADMDRAAGFDPYTMFDEHLVALAADGGPSCWNTVPPSFDLAAAISRDNAAIDDPETVAIYIIHEGISGSAGGIVAIERAMKRGLVVLFDAMSDEQIQHALGLVRSEAAGDPSAKTYFTDPVTGGRKETKLARFDLLPPDILWELAEHYGKGARKYGDRNMERGYPWSKTYAACHRHLNAFWRGENVDAETGSLHLIAAAWHCFTMAWFLRHGAGTDDRPVEKKGSKEKA